MFHRKWSRVGLTGIQTGQVHTEFCLGKVKKGKYLKDLRADGRIFKKWDGEVWTRSVGLKIRTVGGLL
jgi:hypothetical protein